MNIKLKAALEVVAFVVIAVAGSVALRFGLDYLNPTKEQIIGAVAVAAMAILLKTLYDIRVYQLEYAAKLKTLVDKAVQK